MNIKKDVLKKIKMLILDVDGVLTDGSITYDKDGNNLLSFNVHDGYGINFALANGLNIGIITGRKSDAVIHRINDLGIKDFYNGAIDKVTPYEKIKQKYNLSDEEIAYIGDDILDIPVLQRVGLPIVTKNARRETKKYAKHITHEKGGNGAVREVIDMILMAKNIIQDK